MVTVLHRRCHNVCGLRELQRQSIMNWLQQVAIDTDKVKDKFPNLHIPPELHSWLTKIEIIKSPLNYQVSCFCVF